MGALTDDPAGLAGLTLTVGTRRDRLTWSVESTTTRPEQLLGERRYEATGRAEVVVTITVVVRELEPVVAALHRHEGLNLRSVRWDVDEDDPAWPGVRAAAIRAAGTVGETGWR